MLLKLYKTNQHTQKTEYGVQTVKLKQERRIENEFRKFDLCYISTSEVVVNVTSSMDSYQ